MAKKKLLEYTIHLRDKALVDAINAQLNSLAGGTLVGERIRITGGIIPVPTDEYRVLRAPYNAGPPEGGAAVEYAINAGAYPPALPIVEVGGAIPTGGAGYITSPWFNTSNTFPRNVATFTISSGWWIFGSSTKFYWGAKFEYSPLAPGTTTGVEQIDPAPIPTRIAVGGLDSEFEFAEGLAGVIEGGNTLALTRGASRKIDGFGYAHLVGAAQTLHWVVSTITPKPQRARVRWYFRIPEAPDGTVRMWRWHELATANRGHMLSITSALQVQITEMQPAENVLGTFATLLPNTWYCFDAVIYIDAPGDVLYFDLYLNKTKIASVSQAALGAEGSRVINGYVWGKDGGTILSSKARYEFDSVVISEIPQTRDRSKPAWNSATAYVTGDIVHTGSADPATWNTYRALVNNTNVTPGPPNTGTWRKLKDPVDWVRGSHCQVIKPKAFAATHNGAWVGDWRVLGKDGVFSGAISTSIACSTAQALLAVEMGVQEAYGVPGALGWAAMQGTIVCGAGGAPDGRLGYKIGAAASVLNTIVQGAGVEGHSTLFAPVDQTTLQALGTAIELHHEKANDATAATASMFFGCIELVGVFGPEDLDPTETPAPAVPDPVIERHNVHIPLSPWANQPNAMGPVIIVSGTYVGNGLGQDLAFKVPPSFVYIRPLTGDTGGTWWHSAMMDGHPGYDQGTYLFAGMAVRQDFSFAPGSPTDDQQMRWLLRLAGANTQVNAAGVTYQYIAFCDPAKRFCLGGVEHVQTNAVPLVHALAVSTWTPEWVFVFKSLLGSLTTNGHWAKSLAHATDSMKDISGAAVTANALSMAAGLLTFRAGFVSTDVDQYPYLAFRRADGNNDPGQAKVMFMGSYTGDGTASRTVSLAPTSGLRPLWCIVIPDNAAAIHRDPSNTTNTSNLNAGGTTATGITGGGVDSFSVGSTLNANGIVYHYFGFFGCSGAGNGGWSVQCENVPVITEAPILPDVADEPIDVPITTTTTPLVGEPDFECATVILDNTVSVGGTLGGQACCKYTQELLNIALAHIGISKIIAAIDTEQSEAAAQARRFVRKDVNAVLRDYPWDFATAYQNLVLATGSISAPANNDWTYAYTAPNSMMFARRIAKVEKGRKFDPQPIPFREGLFNNRPCIFTNVLATAAVPLVLEYTVRNSCPAFYGDALFREALTWKFAASFAMTLARDKDKQDYCLRVYNALLPKAKVVDANEQQQEPPGDADWISGRN